MFRDLSGNKAESFYGFSVDFASQYGFSVKWNIVLVSKYVCLSFANAIVKEKGKSGIYKKMNATRIATEVYAHAFLYVVGAAIRWPLKETNKIRGVFNTIRFVVGSYLINKCKSIDVNYNEKWYRMIAFNLIWKLGRW